MTPNLFLLNASSLALVCVLVLFARHNKKMGWVKQRASFVADLLQLQKEWDETDQEIAIAQAGVMRPEAERLVPMPPLPGQATLTDTSAFASQLANLQTALQHNAPVVITAAVENREAVTK